LSWDRSWWKEGECSLPEAFICKKAFVCGQHHQIRVIMFLSHPAGILPNEKDHDPLLYKMTTASAKNTPHENIESVHVHVKASTIVSCMHLQPMYARYGSFRADTFSIPDTRCCLARPLADRC